MEENTHYIKAWNSAHFTLQMSALTLYSIYSANLIRKNKFTGYDQVVRNNSHGMVLTNHGIMLKEKS